MEWITDALTLIVFIFILYFLFVCPGIPAKDVSFLCQKPIAHRGVYDDVSVAENSLTAFRLAMEEGFPIELDVRLTEDGVPVVIHDESLGRVCGASVGISEINEADLSEYPLNIGNETIPTLLSVLELVDGRVPLLIELKGEDKSYIAERTAEILSDYCGEYAVQSFNPYYLFRYRRLSPETPIGFLTCRQLGNGFRGKLFALFSENLLFNFSFRPDFISYRYSDELPFSVKLCRKMGTKILAWTVREAEAYHQCTDDFDGIIAENISEIK